MTGQNQTPKDIADDAEGYSTSGRFDTDDTEGHSAKAFKTDDADDNDAEDNDADDDAEGHSLKIG